MKGRITSGIRDTDINRDGRGKVDPSVRGDIRVVAAMDPSGTSGSPAVLLGSFSLGNNGQASFPTADGWDRYYTTFYFLGPNTAPPIPNNYPNTYNQPVLEIRTDHPDNGTGLVAGVVIIDNLNPAVKVASPTLPGSPPRGTAIFNPLGAARKYRVTIFYKNSTVGTLTRVVFTWSYHS